MEESAVSTEHGLYLVELPLRPFFFPSAAAGNDIVFLIVSISLIIPCGIVIKRFEGVLTVLANTLVVS